MNLKNTFDKNNIRQLTMRINRRLDDAIQDFCHNENIGIEVEAIRFLIAKGLEATGHEEGLVAEFIPASLDKARTDRKEELALARHLLNNPNLTLVELDEIKVEAEANIMRKPLIKWEDEK